MTKRRPLMATPSIVSSERAHNLRPIKLKKKKTLMKSPPKTKIIAKMNTRSSTSVRNKQRRLTR